MDAFAGEKREEHSDSLQTFPGGTTIILLIIFPHFFIFSFVLTSTCWPHPCTIFSDWMAFGIANIFNTYL
jgi:hypothetical protein